MPMQKIFTLPSSAPPIKVEALELADNRAPLKIRLLLRIRKSWSLLTRSLICPRMPRRARSKSQNKMTATDMIVSTQSKSFVSLPLIRCQSLPIIIIRRASEKIPTIVKVSSTPAANTKNHSQLRRIPRRLATIIGRNRWGKACLQSRC